MMPGRMVSKRRTHYGYSISFWGVFIGFVLIPALVLAIKYGRYFYVIAEVAKSADTVAVVVLAEINQRTF